MAVRYGAMSPRTVEQPRAFTTQEFITGVFWAVLWFQPLGAAITLVIGLISNPATALSMTLIGGFVGLPASIAAAILGAPLAYCIGRALRSDARDRVHLALFGAYGVSVGLFATEAVGLVIGHQLSAGLMLLPYALAAGVAVPLGWWNASRSALAADAHAGQHPGVRSQTVLGASRRS